ncbi:unnamed protein product [Oppiella nova]|uniref:Uncharacterized protein n=1 Tax=Oppiella nova TaxID=334625 RepID=A0A7R9L769_9ACAR|nr:unnamed protein product [Oppiella nova]CAG2156683.1 unnamed protein product [Oppiella nova]
MHDFILAFLGGVLLGMSNPAKVIGFLDIFGQWDPMYWIMMRHLQQHRQHKQSILFSIFKYIILQCSGFLKHMYMQII